MGLAAEKISDLTYTDLQSFSDNERYELINGQIYAMGAPSTLHQRISMELSIQLGSYFRYKSCQVFAAPFDVRLPEKNQNTDNTTNVVQPDISVICDKQKIDKQGACGAPDWIIEILSPSTAAKDNIEKLALYEQHGVKLYWLLHPLDKILTIYQLGENVYSKPLILQAKGQTVVTDFPELYVDWDLIFELD